MRLCKQIRLTCRTSYESYCFKLWGLCFRKHSLHYKSSSEQNGCFTEFLRGSSRPLHLTDQNNTAAPFLKQWCNIFTRTLREKVRRKKPKHPRLNFSDYKSRHECLKQLKCNCLSAQILPCHPIIQTQFVFTDAEPCYRNVITARSSIREDTRFSFGFMPWKVSVSALHPKHVQARCDNTSQLCSLLSQ